MALELQYQVPVFYMTDLDAAISFFEAMGYVNRWKYGDPPFYAGMFAGEKGENVIHLSLKSTATAATLYLQVADVNTIHAQSEANGLTITREPADQTYGMREFEIYGPEGISVVFGQEIAEQDEVEGFTYP